MDCVAPKIFIGNTLEANSREALERDLIRATICLDGCMKNVQASDLGLEEIVVVPLEDGPGNSLLRFYHAVSELRRLVHTYPRVLVHCHAGISRSAALVTRYLMEEERLNAEDAFARVKQLRRKVMLTPGIEELLN
ncbi:MAG: protein-tyrosine phosphatase, partial [Kiritimatiellia bacterium]|jgi:protein-tyrosine phosphatase